MIKNYLILNFVIFFALHEKMFCQNNSSPISCLRDSVASKAISVYFDTTNCNNKSFSSYEFFYHFLKDEKRNCFCEMLLFAKTFDLMLKNGLDPKYDAVNNTIISYSGASMGMTKAEEEAWEREMKRQKALNQKYREYMDFLEVKYEYEKRVIKRYHEDTTRSLEQDVNSLILYGTYAYPLQLKDILMSKYEHITKDKIWEAKRKLRGY